jgi:hypothetical protein
MLANVDPDIRSKQWFASYVKALRLRGEALDHVRALSASALSFQAASVLFPA